MTTSANVPTLRARCAQSRTVLLQLLDGIRRDSARALCAAFPEELGLELVERLPGFWRSALSRARNAHDTSTLYRLAGWVVALWFAGRGREAAQQLVDWLQDLVDLLWGDEPADPVDVLSPREQRADHAETDLQLAFATGDPTVLEAWIAELERDRAAVSALLIALKRQLLLERKAAA